ncbi:MAG: CehA/McbA family metallohydrolase [Planctomycetota bacterium]
MGAMIAAILAIAALASPTWYKGNTHAHTQLCGHADSTPAAVAQWYLEHGYHFLVLSEHNQFIDPRTVVLPDPRRPDFILIPGEEVTGPRSVHLTALNSHSVVPWDCDEAELSALLQHHTDQILGQGGEPILNHPNFGDAVGAADLEPVERLHFLELYNGHPATHSFGSARRPSTEQLWDELLTHGLVVYAVSADDAHTLKQWGEHESNPGRGWCMVRASELTADAIVRAMRAADFYASSGVILGALEVDHQHYRIAVDEAATARELSSPIVHGRRIDNAAAGWRIEFIGMGGAVIAVHAATSASQPLVAGSGYVRARISFTRHSGEQWEQFYAWTQPAFTDGRVARVHDADAAWRAEHR